MLDVLEFYTDIQKREYDDFGVPLGSSGGPAGPSRLGAAGAGGAATLKGAAAAGDGRTNGGAPSPARFDGVGLAGQRSQAGPSAGQGSPQGYARQAQEPAPLRAVNGQSERQRAPTRPEEAGRGIKDAPAGGALRPLVADRAAPPPPRAAPKPAVDTRQPESADRYAESSRRQVEDRERERERGHAKQQPSSGGARTADANGPPAPAKKANQGPPPAASTGSAARMEAERAAPAAPAASKTAERRISSMNEAQIMDKLRSVVSKEDPSTLYSKIKKVGQG